MLAKAHDAGAIDHPAYVQKLSRLAEAGHGALPLSAADILQAFATDGNQPGRATRALLAQLGGLGAHMTSHFAVARTFLGEVWDRPDTCENRLQLILLVADRLLATAPAARLRFGRAILRDPDNALVLLEYYVSALGNTTGSTTNAA